MSDLGVSIAAVPCANYMVTVMTQSNWYLWMKVHHLSIEGPVWSDAHLGGDTSTI